MVVVASANFNAIHKMYGGDPNVPLKGKDHTCLPSDDILHFAH
jgi:hypothetical protein